MESMRERLLRATATLIRERGLAAATIREVAAAAGVAEGSVYNHFRDKIDLISAAFVEQLPTGLHRAVKRLLDSVGDDDVSANLRAFAVAAAQAYGELDAHAAVLASDPDTAVRLRRELTRRRKGPGRAHEAVAAYLRIAEEQGRVALAGPPLIVATALLGACHEYAFIPLFSEETPFPADLERFAAQLVAALVRQPSAAAE